MKTSMSRRCLSPYTELRIGFGFPRTGELLAGGVTVGLSVDTTVLSGNADMFAIMKAIQNVENSRTESEFKLPARRVLELATIEGARSMGADDRVGSLKPGKRADLIVVGRPPDSAPRDGRAQARQRPGQTLDSDPRGEQSLLAARGEGQTLATERGPLNLRTS